MTLTLVVVTYNSFFNECKSETKLVQKEFNDTITPMVKKVAAVQDVVHGDSEKF